ncbi:hypothetical protein [Bradyrhizobium sp.]
MRNIAHGMPRSKAAEAAAKEAHYGGSSLAANARKRANRKDVKARMIELAAPAQAQVEAELTVDLEKVERRLGQIILAEIDLDNIKAVDVIAAARQLAAIRGWNAPTNVHVTKHDSTDWSTDELVAFVADAEARLAGGEAADRSEAEPDRVH